MSATAGEVGPARAPAPSREPHVAVLCSLFPTPGDPIPGVFIRERMFRVARQLPLVVVSPRPWSPVDGALRRWRPGFRAPVPAAWDDAGVTVHAPRFLSMPGVLKRRDGARMAAALYPLMRRLQADGRLDVLDAHFGYPDGYAAVLLGQRLGVPVTVTFRGTEARLAAVPWARKRLEAVARGATRVFAVSDSLRRVALELGVHSARAEVVSNGVDTDLFRPMDRSSARARLGIGEDAAVLVTVGGLCERKGQHRVIDVLPQLRQRFPRLHYVVVGGGSGEGDQGGSLRERAAALGVADRVHFLGPLPPDAVPEVLSAADVFVLASRNEGWANVLLESLACGVPVVATDVGGNREVIRDERLGRIVPFGDASALSEGVADALAAARDRGVLRQHALEHAWTDRVERLTAVFRDLHGAGHRRAVSP